MCSDFVQCNMRFIVLCFVAHVFSVPYNIVLASTSGGCFCKLEGRIDDCSCEIDTVDHFNNIRVFPVLQSLLVKDFFRYIKVNLNRSCPFWPVDRKCSIQDCSVQVCSEEQLPPALKGYENSLNRGSKETQSQESCDENHGELGLVNETLSVENYQDFQKWQKHDDTIDTFCEIDDESSSELQYIDLLLNPERYTGYSGPSAHRVWNSIYRENCFKIGESYGPYTTSKNLNELCLEKRAFYRAISGLHSSISIHLCAQHFTKDCFGKGEWKPNVKNFKRRFDPATTNGEGPHWLKNLYFVYLLELRAIAKAAPYFENELFFTGNSENDREVQEAVKKLLEIAGSFPEHFNESVMFSGNDKDTKKLKEEFVKHFLNISKIMDCVGCDKCRLWGKIQVQGLGTAFKILFSKDLESNYVWNRNRFRLSRTEVVSLFNAFGRLSNSIQQLDYFRNALSKDHAKNEL